MRLPPDRHRRPFVVPVVLTLAVIAIAGGIRIAVDARASTSSPHATVTSTSRVRPPSKGLVTGAPGRGPSIHQTPEAPPNIQPFLTPALPGEGVWQPKGRTVGGRPVTEATFVRPSVGATAQVMWIDPHLATFRLFAGTSDPGGTGWASQGMVPLSSHPDLAATFNSGFKLSSAHGGYYAYGRYATPLVNGAASFVIFADGTATVGAWGSGDLRMGTNIAAVRQTLTLMVANGRVLPRVNGPYLDWGATLAPYGAADWRTGVGVTRSGGIVFVGGAGLTPPALAETLVRAGCVRAMEFDINPEWPAFNLYTPAPNTALRIAPHQMLPDPMSSPTRYIAVPDSRDFFAVFVR